MGRTKAAARGIAQRSEFYIIKNGKKNLNEERNTIAAVLEMFVFNNFRMLKFRTEKVSYNTI